jgi:hypothetical protein
LYYTRLAYNKEDWKKPSGSERKSLNFKTFERRYNFAFEEWLFDNSMLIDYKKYGFVQGIAQSTQKRLNHNKIIFFTLDSANNTRYKIAELEKWEFVKSSDSIAITKKFKINGWLKKMRKQVEDIGGDLTKFDEVAAGKGNESLFNICFDFKDLNIYSVPILVKKGNPIIGFNRYQLYDI